MPQKSIDTTKTEGLPSFSESENGSTPAYGFDIIDEMLATADASNVSSLQSLQNVTEMIKSPQEH